MNLVINLFTKNERLSKQHLQERETARVHKDSTKNNVT